MVLIQGEAVLEYEDGETLRLGAGDHVLIPAHRRHRVNYTSRTPPCIWIAVFGIRPSLSPVAYGSPKPVVASPVAASPCLPHG